MKPLKAFSIKELKAKEEANESLLAGEFQTNIAIHPCSIETDAFPPYDIFDCNSYGKNTTVLALSVPGFDLERLHVELDQCTLTIFADEALSLSMKSAAGDLDVRRKGIRTRTFARIFDVEEGCDVYRTWKEDGVFFIELIRSTD